MSDYDDYENNLFFEPIGDMSKLNDCNDGKRGSDVLVSAIKKCEKLEKQLKIAVDILEAISTHTCFLDEDIKKQVSIVYNWSSKALEQKLEIAVKAIKAVIREEADNIDGGMLMFLMEALEKIKEIK